MTLSGLSIRTKISLVVTLAFLLVGVIFLISPNLARNDTAGCEVDDERLQSIVLGEKPSAVPAVSFIGSGETKVALADFAGRGVVLNFWATWCAPCVREMPELDRLRAELAADGIDVLAVSMDRAGHSAIDAFYKRTEIQHLDALHDPKNAAGRAFGVRGLPTTVIINPKGEEVARIAGIHHYDTPETKDYLRRCIGHG